MEKIRKILEMDRVVSGIMEEKENRNLKSIYMIMWMVTFTFTVYNIVQRSYHMMISTGILNIVLSMGLIINRIKKNNTLFRMIFIILFFVMFSLYIIKGGNNGFAALWIVVFSYPMMVMVDLKMGFLCCLGWQLVLLLFFLGPLHSYLQYEYEPMFLSRFPILYLTAFVCATFIAIQLRKFQYYSFMTNRELEHIGNYDELTGLQNLRSFHAILDTNEVKNGKIALALLDIDKFKTINDNYGHTMGDAILKEVARLLKEEFREEDILVRIGGDEFAILLKNFPESKYGIIEKKVQNMNRRLQKHTEFPKTSLSVGVAFSENGYHENLYKNADQAMYARKKNGGCACGRYSCDGE